MSRRKAVLQAPQEQSGEFFLESNCTPQESMGASSDDYSADLTELDSSPIIIPQMVSMTTVSATGERLSLNLQGNEQENSPSTISSLSTIPELLGISRDDLDAYTKIREIMDKIEARKQKKKRAACSQASNSAVSAARSQSSNSAVSAAHSQAGNVAVSAARSQASNSAVSAARSQASNSARMTPDSIRPLDNRVSDNSPADFRPKDSAPVDAAGSSATATSSKPLTARTNSASTTSPRKPGEPQVPDSGRDHTRPATSSTLSQSLSTTQSTTPTEPEVKSNHPKQTTPDSVRSRDNQGTDNSSTDFRPNSSASVDATVDNVVVDATVDNAGGAAATSTKICSPTTIRASETSPRRPIEPQMQIRKYQLQLSRHQISEVMEHFKLTITDKTLQRADRAAMIRVGSGLAKLFIQEYSRHFEASQVLKTCLSTIEEIGVEGSAEATTHWEVHDDIAVCYSSFDNRPMEVEHYEKAIELLSKEAITPARYPHMMNNLGNCFKKMKRYDESREMLEKAYEIMTAIHQPGNHQQLPEDYQKVLISLADLYKSMKLNEKAIDVYETLMNGINPDTAPLSVKLRLISIKRSLAKVYRRVGLNEKANELYPDDDSAYGTADLADALTDNRSTGSRGEPKINLVFSHVGNIRKAEIADSAGNNREAIRYYEMALEDVKNARDEVRSAIDKPEVISSVHNNCGTCYISTGQYHKAQEHLKESLRLRVERYGPKGINEDLATSFFNLGNLYRKWDRENEALPNYRSAARIFETLAPDARSEITKWLLMTYRALKRVFEVLKNPEYKEEAKGYYQKALDIYKRFGSLDQDSRIEMSVFYEALGDEQNALAILEE